MKVTVTGHRPNKLGGYTLPVYERLTRFAMAQIEELKQAPTIVNTGMAQGWDMAVAYACYRMKIPYHAWVPFEGQELLWSDPDQAWYIKLLMKADQTTICCPGSYHSSKMMKRNQMMVDDLGTDGMVLALFNGTGGGTGNCVHYAKHAGHTVKNVWGEWVKAEETLHV